MIFNILAIGSDHRGYWLKNDLVDHFKNNGYIIKDFGTENDCVGVDYPDYAKKVSEYVASHQNAFGILVCHSGIGMSIAANRFKGVRAVLCYDPEIAKLAREHNNANVLCFGSAFINTEYAIESTNIFATTKLADERHLVRINKIDENQ